MEGHFSLSLVLYRQRGKIKVRSLYSFEIQSAHVLASSTRWTQGCKMVCQMFFRAVRLEDLRAFNRESQSKIPNCQRRAAGIEGSWKFVPGVSCFDFSSLSPCHWSESNPFWDDTSMLCFGSQIYFLKARNMQRIKTDKAGDMFRSDWALNRPFSPDNSNKDNNSRIDVISPPLQCNNLLQIYPRIFLEKLHKIF